MAEQIRAVLGPAAARVVPALGWKLLEAAALCAEAAFYVGNDTGAMNLAAAAGTRSFGLFGATAPFDHAHAIVPVMPPDGRIDPMHGMARIDVAGVLAAIARDRAARGAAA